MNGERDKTDNPHKNHRSRVRSMIRKAGIESVPDITMLEYLLFYSIPRKDTNEIAHRLLDVFGTLNGVFNAGYDRLIEVEGMGESSALLISMVPGICKRYIESGESKKINLSEPEDAANYIKTKFYGSKTEAFYMICLDALGNLINCCKLGEGTTGTVLVDKRITLEAALRNNADTVIFAHNHPNGIAAPSKDDIDMTGEFAAIFRNMGIRLADHIIVAGDDTLRLSSLQKYSILFR